MIKTPANKAIKKQLTGIIKSSIQHERREGMNSEPEPVRPSKLSVNAKVERLYKKQVPVIAGGVPNMEIQNEDQRDDDVIKLGGAKKRGAKKIVLDSGLGIQKAPLVVVPEVIPSINAKGGAKQRKAVEGAKLVGGADYIQPIKQQNNLPFPSGGAKQAPAKPKGNRHEIVKKVMRERGLNLPQASKYVKDNGLY